MDWKNGQSVFREKKFSFFGFETKKAEKHFFAIFWIAHFFPLNHLDVKN